MDPFGAPTNEEDFSKLSLSEKINHKAWKARVQGYEALKKLMEESFDTDKIFQEYDGKTWKNFLSDSNLPAQEKAFEAFLVWLDKAKEGSKSAPLIAPILVQKGLASAKSGTKQNSVDALLLYIELENPNPIIEELITGTKQKNPKIVIGSLTCIHSIIHTFGPKTLPFKTIIKMITSGIFDHSDKNVRAAAFNITVELYRWMGASIQAQISELRPVQKTELENAFKDLPSGKPQPIRRLRSEQDQPEISNNNNNNNNKSESLNVKEEEEEEENFDINPYELADPVDIFSKISSETLEKLNEKKWQTKIEGLEEIFKVSSVIKISPSNQINPLVKTLNKLITDININVNVKTILVIGALAKGLRKDFPSGTVLVTLLQKFKEKKATVTEPIHTALSTMYEFGCFTIVDILPELTENMKNKVPTVRENTMQWINSTLSSTKKQKDRAIISKSIKQISDLLISCFDDSVESVRNATAQSLAQLAGMVPQKTAKVFLDRLDKIKFAKVEEFMAPKRDENKDNDESSTASNSKISKTGSSSTALPSYLKSTNITKKTVVSSIPKKQKSTTSKKKKPTEKKQKKETSSPKVEIIEETIPSIIETEEALEKIGEIISQDLISKFSSSKWQERKEALEELSQFIKNQGDDLTKENCNIIFRLIEKNPSFKDIPQVTAAIYSLIGTMAETCKNFCKSATVLIIPYLIEKIGDAKLKTPALSTLTILAEAHNIGFIIKEISPLIMKSKNPKTTQEGILWIQNSLEEFHLVPSISVKSLIELIKTGLDLTNPTIRTASTKLACTLRKFVGAPLLDFFGDLKGPKLTSLEKEFSKVGPISGEPKRFSRDEPKNLIENSNKNNSGSNLLPREDLSSKISSSVIQQLSDGPLKAKRQAIEEIEQAINSCHKRINSNLPPELLNVLKNRLSDNTALLVISTLELLSLLAKSMESSASKHAKNIIPSILSCMTRNQKNIKEAAASTMDAWEKQVTLEPLIEHVKAILISSTTSRKDVLSWLSKHMEKPIPSSKDLIKPLSSCLEDKNADCRKLSENILRIIASILTPTEISKYSSDSKLVTILNTGTSSQSPKENDQPSKITEKKKATTVLKTEKASDLAEKTKIPISKLPKPSIRKPITSSTITNIRPKSNTVSGFSKIAKTATPKNSPLKNSPKKTLNEPALIERNNQKEVRIKKSMKQKPWYFENDKPEQDQIESVKKELSAWCSEQLIGKLFAKDFNKHIDALNILVEFLEKDDALAVFDNLDLFFKWLTFRLIENNTALIKKCFDFLSIIFTQLEQRNELLSDPEAVILLPFLVEKVGSSNELIKTTVRELFRSLSRVYPDSKLFKFIFEGIHSKNSKTRAESIDELGLILERQGLSVCVKSKILPQITEKLTDRDVHVRNTVMNCLTIIYNQIGSDLFQYIPEKEKQSTIEKLEKQQQIIQQTPKKQIPNPQTPEKIPLKTILKNEPLTFDIDQSDLESFHSNASNQVSPLVEKVKNGDVETLKMLCLSEDDTVFMLDSNSLVEALTNLLRESLNISSGSVPWRLYKYILNTLHRMFREANIAKCISYKPLQGLIRELTMAVVNPLLQGEDEKVIVKATNQLLAKVLDNTDRTDSFTILLQYLTELVPQTIAQTPDQQRLIGLVIKCLLTLARTLKTVINQLELKLILRDIHKFLQSHPPDLFKKHSEKDNLPLMAIKTILSEIVTSKREEVHDHLELIPINKKEPPAILLYITTMLKQNQAPTSTSSSATSETRVCLTNIFKKIAQNKDQGLLELWNFKKQHPNVNVESYISGSERFQTIIRKGLAEIEKRHKVETQQKTTNTSAPLKDRTNSTNPIILSPSNSGPVSLSTLRERLNQIEQSTMIKKSETKSDDFNSKENTIPVLDSTNLVSTSASDLKERLARLKAKMPPPLSQDD